tara:strand:+ start:2058 stop:2987 length:930 start_codon:yes stop_codon:yes gene_type:complete
LKQKTILVTGKLPPPVGGVTVFISYLYQAFDRSKKVKLLNLSLSNLLFKSYDAFLINASNSKKRLLFIILGRLLFKKTFFIKHGGLLNLSSISVRLSLFLSHGVICLNEDVKKQLTVIGVRTKLITTVFAENISAFDIEKEKPMKLTRGDEKCKVLFYINNDSVINGEEVYGAKFLISCLHMLENDFLFTVIDLSKKYEDGFSVFSNVVYYQEPQNFSMCLKENHIYIRPTSTDGMSVALLEAGVMGVRCLASDAVQRPSFVFTYKYKSRADFITQLNKLAFSNDIALPSRVELNSASDLESFIFPHTD